MRRMAPTRSRCSNGLNGSSRVRAAVSSLMALRRSATARPSAVSAMGAARPSPVRGSSATSPWSTSLLTMRLICPRSMLRVAAIWAEVVTPSLPSS
ncbi:hypothetical protein FQZ97_1125330 [compost metagenome]